MRASRKTHKRVHDHVAAALATMPSPFLDMRPRPRIPSARAANIEFIIRCDHADDERDFADMATGILESEPALTDEQVARRISDIIEQEK